jgi:cytochrome P450 family 142 subfamily A polypeptide 1
MFTELVARMPDIALAAGPDGGGLPLRPSNFVSGLEAMPVTFSPSARVGG